MFTFHTTRRSLAVPLLLIAALLLAGAPASAAPTTTALRAAPAMLYGSNTNTTMFRWSSSGSSFSPYSSRWSVPTSSYSASQVGDRMVSGDFNGDGTDDIATAYDYGTYFRFHVWLSGVSSPASWYEGAIDLDNVQGRMVAGDWDGDGRDDLALGYDYGNGTARIYRFRSTGSSFSHMAGDWVSGDGAYSLTRVGDRMVSGDFNSDGRDDIATAYDYNTYFRFHVWLNGASSAGSWFEPSSFDLAAVQDRMVAGDWNGDGSDDLALGYDYGNGTARIYRFNSSGSSFAHTAGDWVSGPGSYTLSQVDDRMAAGDVNGDGRDDVVMAYDYGGYFRYHVWLNGASSPGSWFESGPFSLDLVQGRFVLGRW